ncbi:Cell division protein FtsB [Actinokineospora alba]|uniref:Cell division protein FtsB n=1 Tax=Actinokineospora alba TaxID=504798 RepID=A0A1H0RYD8_9PSEU|nr:septum formation initiator family protein [Actinokineospora alba]TDP66859.1 cell division protein FtsB [Actinokineospora alba]SDI48027.1 Cell division protein FtsB [Actinokineospora alba]SDP34500.1 Cell division protein FtsB [Actinokineospora alba]
MAGRGGDRGGRRGGASAARRPESVRRTRPAAAVPAKEPPKRPPAKRATRLGPLGLSTTRRAAVLATVVGALALSVAVPLRTYLSQRTDVQVQERRQAELRAEVEELERRKAQLADPAQIQAEAKRRLRYVMPGETPYMVELPAEAGGPGAGQKPTHPISQQAWYQALWDSVHGAGR